MTLRLESVGLDEPGSTRLDALDLELQPGEIFVVLGPNGCGKSTFLRLCIGLIEPTSGQVHLFRRALHQVGNAEREALRRRVGFLFQEGALLGALTVRENLALPLAYASDLGARERHERVERCLELVGLSKDADAKPPALSLGKRKRAALARAVVARPELLLLDDPTSGLDSLQAYESVALIASLCRETGAACLVVSNDATRFLRAAGRVAVLYRGTFTSIGRPEEVMNSDDPWLTEVYEKLMRAESTTGGYR